DTFFSNVYIFWLNNEEIINIFGEFIKSKNLHILIKNILNVLSQKNHMFMKSNAMNIILSLKAIVSIVYQKCGIDFQKYDIVYNDFCIENSDKLNSIIFGVIVA